MKKRLTIAISLLLVFTFLLLTGCTGKKEGLLSPKNPVTVTLWHYYSGRNHEAIEAAVNEFNKTIGIEKGIIVDPIRIASISELETEIKNSAKGVVNSEPMPAIFSSYPDVAFKVDRLGKIINFNDYFTAEELENYMPAFLDVGVLSKGKLSVLPVAKSTELLYINDTAWQAFAEETGHTDDALTTWESIRNVAEEYYHWMNAKTPEADEGRALLGFDSVANYLIIGGRQLGVEVINSNLDGTGKVILDESVMRRLFDVYYDATCLGYFGAYGEFRADDVKQGDIISYVASSSGASYFPTQVTDGSALVPIDFKAMPYPIFEGGKHYAVQQGAGMCVTKTNDAKEQGAVEFLKWFTSEEHNVNFAMETGYLPVQKGAYESGTVSDIIDDLHHGDKNEQIIAKVYDISFKQITDMNTYAAKPFKKSHSVRALLEDTLMEITERGAMKADALRQQGAADDAILAELHAEKPFEEWMARLIQELDDLEVTYVVQ